MDLKVLFVVFLCLLSASIIYNVTIASLNAADGWSFKTFTHTVHSGYFTDNEIEPMGDPIGGGGWPR